jgi:hypothetical protein
MTTLAGDIGVFKNTANSGGVTTGVAANTGSGTIFASATTLAAAAAARTSPTPARLPDGQARAAAVAGDRPGGDPNGFLRHRRQGHDREHRRRRPRLGLEVQYVDNGT